MYLIQTTNIHKINNNNKSDNSYNEKKIVSDYRIQIIALHLQRRRQLIFHRNFINLQAKLQDKR